MKMRKQLLLGILAIALGSVGVSHQVHGQENNLTIAPRVIIDEDNRVQVPNEQLNQEPYRWTVFLNITFEDGSRYYASGAMISKDTVLTCGHALFKSGAGWATDVKVHAGYDGVNNTYYAQSSEILGMSSWTSGGNMDYLPDIAAIKLDRNLGEQTGWFPIQKQTLLQEQITVTGFPGTKNKTMWTDKGVVTKQYRHGIGYNADSDQGNSGCPVYNQKNELVAIHSGALMSSSQGTHNTGTGFTDEVKKVVDFWVTGQAEVEVTSVSLSDNQLTLEKGAIHYLEKTVLPVNAFYKEGKWTSSNTSIATVNHQGKVTAKNKGKATITFTTDDNKKAATCEVTVNNAGHVPVEDIQFSRPDEIENAEKGSYFGMGSPTIIPSNATNKEIYYTTSDKEILDMDLKDPFTPRYRKAGTVDIYCHSRDNGKQYKAKTVKVDDHGEDIAWATPIESGVSQSGYFYKYYDIDQFRFEPTASGEYMIEAEAFGGKSSGELNKYWEFTISNENNKALQISQNRTISYSFEAGKTYYVLPKLRRFAHIDEEDYKTHYKFDIFPKGTPKPNAITAITLDKNKLEVMETKKEILQTDITPTDTTDSKELEWTSSDESIATVSNGEVTGVKEGTATITAKTVNGKTATCEVTVTKLVIPVEDIKFPYTDQTLQLEKGSSLTKYGPTFVPENATNKEVYYTSSNKKVLDLSDDPGFNKRYTASEAGTTEIYCHSKDTGKAYRMVTYQVDDHGKTRETATPIESEVPQAGYFYRSSYYGQMDRDYFKFTPEKSGEYLIDNAVVGPNSDDLNKAWALTIQNEKGLTLLNIKGRYRSFVFEAGVSYYIYPELNKYAHLEEEIYKTNYVLTIFPKGTDKPRTEADVIPLERLAFPYADKSMYVEKGTTFQDYHHVPVAHPKNASNKEFYFSSSNKDIINLDLKPGYYQLSPFEKPGEVDIFAYSWENKKTYKVVTYIVDDHGAKPAAATSLESGVTQKGYLNSYHDEDYFEFIPKKSGSYRLFAEALGEKHQEYNELWEFVIKDETNKNLATLSKRYMEYSFEEGKKYYIVPRLRKGSTYFVYETDYLLDVFETGKEKPNTNPNRVPVEKIEFQSSTQVLDAEKNERFYLPTPIFSPTNATNKEYYLTSSDSNILNIDSPYARYEKSGQVDVYCHSWDNGKSYKAMSILVDDHGSMPGTATPIESGITQKGYFNRYSDVDYFKFTPQKSGEYVLEADAIGEYKEELNKCWRISINDEKRNVIYSKDAQTLSYSFEAGKTYYLNGFLTWCTPAGVEGHKTNYTFDIYPKGEPKPNPITEISLDKATMELDEGTSQSLQATITPEDTTNDKTIEWTSSDDAIATVTNGEITGIKEGQATITAKTSNGLTATCEVTVNKVIIPVERIELSVDRYRSVCIGLSAERITAKVFPENATNQKIEWSSSDPSVVSVEQNGKITGLQAGASNIRATIDDVSAEMEILAFDPIEHIVIDRQNEPLAALESIEKEFDLPDGENRKYRIRLGNSSNNNTWNSGQALMSLGYIHDAQPFYNRVLANSTTTSIYDTSPISAGKLQLKLWNRNEYQPVKARIELRIYPLEMVN